MSMSTPSSSTTFIHRKSTGVPVFEREFCGGSNSPPPIISAFSPRIVRPFLMTTVRLFKSRYRGSLVPPKSVNIGGSLIGQEIVPKDAHLLLVFPVHFSPLPLPCHFWMAPRAEGVVVLKAALLRCADALLLRCQVANEGQCHSFGCVQRGLLAPVQDLR